MDPLVFSILATAIAGLFLLVFSFYKYKWTKDLIWLLVMIIGIVFLCVSTLAVKQKRELDRKLAIEHPVS